MPDAKTRRFMEQYELKRQDAILLTSEKSLADYFEAVVSKSKSPAKTVHSWIAGEFMRYMNDSGLALEDIILPAEKFAQLIDMVTDKTISGNSAKVVFNEMLKERRRPAGNCQSQKSRAGFRYGISFKKPSKKS